MTVWDELWTREITEDETNWRVTLEWLQEVKAEGDRLQIQLETIRKLVSDDTITSIIKVVSIKAELGILEGEG